MANVENSNSFYVDAASSSGTATSYIDTRGIRLHYLVFNGLLAGDKVVISDMASDGTIAVGATKLEVRTAVANGNVYIDFGLRPINFPNGIWIASISASCNVTLVGSTAS